MVVTLLLAGGVALAANIQCLGGLCVGTQQNDRITGSQERDEILALGGRDLVTARGGDDFVDGGRGRDDISGGVGGDGVFGGGGRDDIDGGPGTTDAIEPPNSFSCDIQDTEAGIVTVRGTQNLLGDNGNDNLDGGRDNDLLEGGAGRNDLSGNGGDDCLLLSGAANERASGGDGDDLIGNPDGNGDDIFCGAGHDTVVADEEDRVAANCEDVIEPSPLQATGATPVVEVTITTAEGTITMTP
jgi:Ca2+-binding RTX toxin-like protein